jgi:hypothetical protein
MAINEIPMTLIEIDTTAAIVEAAMILFRYDPVTDRKLRPGTSEAFIHCFGRPSGK